MKPKNTFRRELESSVIYSLTDRVAPEKFVKNLVTSPPQAQITNARETVQTLAALSSNPSEILNKYEELKDKKYALQLFGIISY